MGRFSLALIVFLGFYSTLAQGYGLCDIVHVLSSWKNPCPCTYDFNQDGQVDLQDIVFILAHWDGSSSCDATAAPAVTTWSVSSLQSTVFCHDITLNASVTFTGNVPVTGFILQGDAPAKVATVVSVNLTGWDASCQIVTIQQYTYFSCSGGRNLKGGDVVNVSYVLRNLGTGIGIFKSEITTFPPLQISNGTSLDMLCGSTIPTTTTTTTTVPPAFEWTAAVSGPATVCGANPATFVVNITVLSGVGFPFLVSSAFIRNEGLAFNVVPQSSISGVTCAFSSSSFSCDGVADQSFSVTFTIIRQGTLTSGSATITILTGLDNTNALDQFAFLPITYGPSC